MTKRVMAIAAVAAVVAALSVGGGAAMGSAAPGHAGVVAHPLARVLSMQHFATPPTTKYCRSQLGISCYGPQQIETAYDMGPLYSQGLDGTGKTILIVDSFGSPTIAADLAQFDEDFGLPAPPSFRVVQPSGPVPPFDPNDGTMVGWAVETTLDVEWAHSMAPGANIVLAETPTAETEGAQGFPDMIHAENVLIDAGVGDVISQSFGASEPSFSSSDQITALRSAILNAQAHDVTMLAASGDFGAAAGKFNGLLYTQPAIIWPASDPLVTAVGGTQLHLDPEGDRGAPDNVWNDSALFGEPAAGGGGVSTVFDRPDYQDSVSGVVGGSRGIPDVSLSAAVDGGALVYLSFLGASEAGYYVIGGTSWATPLFSGIVAVADQAAGHDLGELNPALYAAWEGGSAGIVDVTRGNNRVTFTQGGQTYSFGFKAVTGYDLASGLGTVDGNELVAALSG